VGRHRPVAPVVAVAAVRRAELKAPAVAQATRETVTVSRFHDPLRSTPALGSWLDGGQHKPLSGLDFY
jgi:hypothetical protein